MKSVLLSFLCVNRSTHGRPVGPRIWCFNMVQRERTIAGHRPAGQWAIGAMGILEMNGISMGISMGIVGVTIPK